MRRLCATTMLLYLFPPPPKVAGVETTKTLIVYIASPISGVPYAPFWMIAMAVFTSDGRDLEAATPSGVLRNDLHFCCLPCAIFCKALTHS